MRHLLLSDIHANDVALEAVMRDAERRRCDRLLFLGDAVGYYTGPERAVRLLMELEPAVCLLGNHDQLLLDMVAGKSEPTGEAEIVTEVLERHVSEVSAESLRFISRFEQEVRSDQWQAVHGALRRPWEYLDRLPIAQANFPLLEKRICFVGHTHIPQVFASVDQAGTPMWRTVSFRKQCGTYRIPPNARLFFNPGSVGQPRDGLPLASYAVYDDELSLLEVYRVEFDLLKVQRSVIEQGYPKMLAERLAVGR